jgi:hypothetical protein
MTRLTSLIEMRDAIRIGTWPGDLDIFEHREYMLAFKAFNGSLDSPESLHEAVISDWLMDALWQGGVMSKTQELWHCRIRNLSGTRVIDTDERNGYNSPARAWFLAIIEALITKEKAL